jgi:transcriptional regulator with XRE-family HTH domain
MKGRGAYGKGGRHHLATTLGERVRLIRLAWGWTQNQLAKAINSKQNVISHWENNSTQPSGTALGSLAGLFRVSPESLISGIGFSIPPPPIGDEEGQTQIPRLTVHLPISNQTQALHVDHQSATAWPIRPNQAAGLIREAVAAGKHVWLVTE